MSDGYFITVSGIDNSGKTTLIPAIEDIVQQNGCTATTTSEPSPTWTGEAVRKSIHGDTSEHPITTFFLFMADRNKHIQETILPALERGEVVVSDRFADSTRAYQPIALEDAVSDPDALIDDAMAEWSIEPDLTLYIDITVDESIARGGGDDVYENREFLERVQDNYEAINDENKRVVRIDGMQPQNEVVKECAAVITKELTKQTLMNNLKF